MPVDLAGLALPWPRMRPRMLVSGRIRLFKESAVSALPAAYTLPCQGSQCCLIHQLLLFDSTPEDRRRHRYSPSQPSVMRVCLCIRALPESD